MPLYSPQLDDRTFAELVEEAKRRVQEASPEWTDLSPGDPGMVLLEAFAYLTETTIYRLNQLPDKVYVELLRLLGVKLQPPAAARALVRFSRNSQASGVLEIPRGTRITSGGSSPGETPVFVTTAGVKLGAGETVEVSAYHCELVDAELVATGNGLPGQQVQVARPPIVSATDDRRELTVGVETDPDTLEPGEAAVQYGNRSFRIWQEVEAFTGGEPGPYVYVADRQAGIIQFAPAVAGVSDGKLSRVPQALAAVPPNNAEIRVWYWRGGGPQGNVAAGALTVLKDALPGVIVTNSTPAVGGAPVEALDNALTRGPQALHGFDRAITARDFERLALRSSRAVARAKAFTRASLWAHALPGTVELLLVPELPGAKGSELTRERLLEVGTETVRESIERTIAARRPLGTACVVNWARFKTVSIRARAVIYRQEDPVAVRERLLDRLYNILAPLPRVGVGSGWPFGRALRAWHVYEAAGVEPGVSYLDRVELVVDRSPSGAIDTLAADGFQPQTWYAGQGGNLFRSVNDGNGWEPIGAWPEERISLVRTFPATADPAIAAGLVVVACELSGESDVGTRLHLSRDCGESWERSVELHFQVRDLTWLVRDRRPVLLLATDVGLYELGLGPEDVPVQVLVDPDSPDLGFFSVAASVDIRGMISVAVAARKEKGVYLSSQGGLPQTFSHIGLAGQLVHVLRVQQRGPHAYLWAGLAAVGNDKGKGCLRWRLTGDVDSPAGWTELESGWDGGSCMDLAFQGAYALAGTLRAGLLRLNTDDSGASWERPSVDCGLPLREVGRLEPVEAVAAASGQNVMTGGSRGIYRSADGGHGFEYCSGGTFTDCVTLPETWLFCSGEHEIEVVSEDDI